MIYTIIISLHIEKQFYLLRPQSFSFQIVSEFTDTFVKFSNFMSRGWGLWLPVLSRGEGFCTQWLSRGGCYSLQVVSQGDGFGWNWYLHYRTQNNPRPRERKEKVHFSLKLIFLRHQQKSMKHLKQPHNKCEPSYGKSQICQNWYPVSVPILTVLENQIFSSCLHISGKWWPKRILYVSKFKLIHGKLKTSQIVEIDHLGLMLCSIKQRTFFWFTRYF